MTNNIKLQVPCVFDDPIVGRVSSPLPWIGGYDHILIMNTLIGYIEAFEKKPRRLYKIKEIQKFVVILREHSCWNKDYTFKPWAKSGTEMEVLVLNKDGTSLVLIPAFSIQYGKKDWDLFLKELSELTEIPLEERHESQQREKRDNR